MKKVIIFLLLFFPIFKPAMAQEDSVNAPWGWKRTQQEIENLSEKMDKSFYAEIGGNEQNYPLTVAGLREAIASLDSGIVYINYPGLWDTTGVGEVPGKIYLKGWLFGELILFNKFIVSPNGSIFSGKADGRRDILTFQDSYSSGYIRSMDSTLWSFWGVICGIPGENFLNMYVTSKSDVASWRTWDDNQGQLISGPGNFNGLNLATLGNHDIIFSTNNWLERGRFVSATGNFKLVSRLIQKVDVTNVSNPPTSVQLNSAFPNSVEGEVIFIDDANTSTNFYICIKEGSNWWIFTGTKAL